jgi:hypothetical protein
MCFTYTCLENYSKAWLIKTGMKQKKKGGKERRKKERKKKKGGRKGKREDGKKKGALYSRSRRSHTEEKGKNSIDDII